MKCFPVDPFCCYNLYPFSVDLIISRSRSRRPEQSPRRPEQLPRRLEQSPHRPEQLPDRPEQLPRRPEQLPRRLEQSPDRPEQLPRRLERSPVNLYAIVFLSIFFISLLSPRWRVLVSALSGLATDLLYISLRFHTSACFRRTSLFQT